jgi:hypothetical protein
MALAFSKAVAAAASAGLLLGALGACHNKARRSSKTAHDATGSTAGAKACCKGMNECRGKGGCAVEGKNGCAGKNDCKGQGGCNGHCPK